MILFNKLIEIKKMLYFEEILKAIEDMNFEEALKLIEVHRDEHGNKPEFINAQAILCVQTQEFEAACNILLDAIARYPANADLMYNLGYTYQYMNDDKKALELYKRTMELTDDVDFLSSLSVLCAEIESSLELIQIENEADKSRIKINVISQGELHSMDFNINLSIVTQEKIRFLLRRIEFGIKAEEAGFILSTLLSRGKISKKKLEKIINLSWVDKSRFSELADILNSRKK